MQTSKLKIIVFLWAGIFIPAVCFGVMRPDFPDSRSLQPMPQNVAADISHNVNAQSLEVQAEAVALPADRAGAAQNQPRTVVKEKSFDFRLAIFLLLVALLAAYVWIWLKWQKRK